MRARQERSYIRSVSMTGQGVCISSDQEGSDGLRSSLGAPHTCWDSDKILQVHKLATKLVGVYQGRRGNHSRTGFTPGSSGDVTNLVKNAEIKKKSPR